MTLARISEKITTVKPTVWGDSTVGYGDIVMRYSNEKILQLFVAGFSPCKAYISIYLTTMYLSEDAEMDEFIGQLGKCKVGKGCITIKRLADVDTKVLKMIISKILER